MENKKKICVITGANTGIGYETALTLGIAGWEVVLACRSFAKGNQAVMEMNNLFRQIDPNPNRGGGRAVFMEADLASFDSLEKFTEGFRKRYSSCDVLICNAGIMAAPYGLTEDGFETQFQVNYLGHAYLFASLLPYLRAAGSARIISLSSRAHERAKLKQGEFIEAARRTKETYKSWNAYAQSKLFQIIFTRKAQEHYGGQGLSFYAVHPGIVKTGLLLSPLPGPVRILLAPLIGTLTLTGAIRKPRKGSETAAYLALPAEAPGEGGTYWADKKIRPQGPLALDEDLGKEVWKETRKILQNAEKPL
jgi:NAD(P)-dependent dehydrogenase (short-subunit alcohol dehydrogenase family)